MDPIYLLSNVQRDIQVGVNLPDKVGGVFLTPVSTLKHVSPWKCYIDEISNRFEMIPLEKVNRML